MTRTIRLKSDAAYSGKDALEIVEQMRLADFDPPPTVRDYVIRAVARASHYFGITMRVEPLRGTEDELASAFLAEAIEKGCAEEVKLS